MVGDHRVKQVQQCQVTRRCNLVSLHIKQQKVCQRENTDKMAYGLTELCCCFYRFERQNEEKNQKVPHMLAYVEIFLYLCAPICEYI